MSNFSGPCKSTGRKPIRNDPSGPGIRLANILTFQNLKIITIVNIKVVKNKTIQIKFHIIEFVLIFKSTICK